MDDTEQQYMPANGYMQSVMAVFGIAEGELVVGLEISLNGKLVEVFDLTLFACEIYMYTCS